MVISFFPCNPLINDVRFLKLSPILIPVISPACFIFSCNLAMKSLAPDSGVTILELSDPAIVLSMLSIVVSIVTAVLFFKFCISAISLLDSSITFLLIDLSSISSYALLYSPNAIYRS